VVPYVTTPWATYTSLFILVGLHLTINYLGVRGLHLRTLNRQRTSIAWLLYRSQNNDLTPSTIAGLERIFERPSIIRDVRSHVPLGQCTIGSSFSRVLRTHPCPSELFDLLANERYILWFDRSCLRDETNLLHDFARLHIFLKDKYTNEDQLRAWIHAVEVCRDVAAHRSNHRDTDALQAIQTAYEKTSLLEKPFLQALELSHWITSDSAILNGSPDSVITSVEAKQRLESIEGKKTR